MLTSLAVALSSPSSLASLGSLSLAVPYLPQTDALCGGAAAAMVFRYWGDVHADIKQFTPLVNKHAGGIANDVLVKAVEARGWRAVVAPGSIDQLSQQIRSRHPVVILVADRGPLSHYLVVTGIQPGAIIVHDPAWGPSRRLLFADLMRMWRPTDFWSMVILPAESRATSDVAPATTLEVSGPLSELAGQRFAERRWREAADLAGRAAASDATDRYAWEVLAASRFMQDDVGGALRAWNRIGKPRINLVAIDGLVHARFQTTAALMGLRPNMLLTESAFRLAERRLRDLPNGAAVRLTLRPELDGFVTVRAVVVERDGPPRGAVAWTPPDFRLGLIARRAWRFRAPPDRERCGRGAGGGGMAGHGSPSGLPRRAVGACPAYGGWMRVGSRKRTAAVPTTRSIHCSTSRGSIVR